MSLNSIHETKPRETSQLGSEYFILGHKTKAAVKQGLKYYYSLSLIEENAKNHRHRLKFKHV